MNPARAFMQVVNPEIMQVRVEANQQDFPRLQVGQSGKFGSMHIRTWSYPQRSKRSRQSVSTVVSLRNFVILPSSFRSKEIIPS